MIIRLRELVPESMNSYASACELDKNYFVYAVLSDENNKNKSYMINVWGSNTNNTIYDIPPRFFKIVDNSIPSNWEEDSYEAYRKAVKINSFPEMAHDRLFYDKLMNNDPNTVNVFKHYQNIYENGANKPLP